MRRAGMICVLWLSVMAVAVAQTPPPKPGPELKRLDMFTGTWTLDGSMKPGMMGPGGTTTENDKCEWMDGGFYVVCHSTFKTEGMGNGVGLSVLGYSTEDKAYTYREFNSFGEFDDSKGKIDGDTWTWTNEEKVGGMAMKGRYTIKVTSATSYNFMYEMSEDGKKWTTVLDGKAMKK